MSPSLRLRELAFGARLGLSGVVVSLLIGITASLAYLQEHHQNRDGEPGVSLDDLRGAYHGIERPAPLARALERGHPEGLAAADRELLSRWLAGGRVSEAYDDLDLGDAAPAEVIQRACLACHSRRAEQGDGIGTRLPLEYWDDVEKQAFSRNIAATPREILVVTTHTHALALGTLTLAVILLVLATRAPALLKNALVLVAGIALATDLAAWWLSRSAAGFVLLVVAAGGCWAAAMVTGCFVVLADLWLPVRRG